MSRPASLPAEEVEERDDARARLEAIHPEAFGWALVCTGRDPDAAREVLQMTYVKVLENRARWDGRASYRTWLFAVIRNTARDGRRREALSLGRLARWWRLRPQEPGPRGPESEAAAAETSDRLRKALELLSRRQREVVHLVFYHGLPIDEAAGVLGLAPGTARLHYERAKRRLRQRLLEEPRS